MVFFYSGFVVYRIRVRRGGRKRPVPKGATYGKPKSHGVNQLKPVRNLQSLAEVRYFLISFIDHCIILVNLLITVKATNVSLLVEINTIQIVIAGKMRSPFRFIKSFEQLLGCSRFNIQIL